MAVLRVVTINLLVDLTYWTRRRPLLEQGLKALDVDMVAVQEVKLPQNTAGELAERLGYQVFLSPKSGLNSQSEGIAILSRLPVQRHETLDLGSQYRVAQLVEVKIGESPLIFANGHFFWQPGESKGRLKQVELFLAWLERFPSQIPIIVCGDFNGTPETTAIQAMRRRFQSAYAAVYGHEPEYTCPTPLPRSRWADLRTFLGFWLLLRPKYMNPHWRGTLDYIFTSPQVSVQDCRVVLDKPAADDHKIFPSDHFGLAAQLEIP